MADTNLIIENVSLDPVDAVASLKVPSSIVLSGNGEVVHGTGTPGNKVVVLDNAGVVIGEGRVHNLGSFFVKLDEPYNNGQNLSVKLIDAAGHSSPAVALTAPDAVKPDFVKDLEITDNGLSVVGVSEINAEIIILDSEGVLLGRQKADTNGNFKVPLSALQETGSDLKVYSFDEAGNRSDPATIKITEFEAGIEKPITEEPPVELIPQQPDVGVAEIPLEFSKIQVSGNGEGIKGETAPLALVKVTDSNGAEIGSQNAFHDGFFYVELEKSQKNGEQLNVTASDKDGRSSAVVELTAPDLTAPLTVHDVLYDGAIVSGRGEPGAGVYIENDSDELVVAIIGSDGRFEVEIPDILKGHELKIEVVDSGGNISVPYILPVTPLVDDVSIKPETATGEAVVDTSTVLNAEHLSASDLSLKPEVKSGEIPAVDSAPTSEIPPAAEVFSTQTGDGITGASSSPSVALEQESKASSAQPFETSLDNLVPTPVASNIEPITETPKNLSGFIDTTPQNLEPTEYFIPTGIVQANTITESVTSSEIGKPELNHEIINSIPDNSVDEGLAAQQSYF